MAKLAFYRQARVDGGIRTGVDRGDTPLLHEFQKGSDQDDPAIAWYVDIEFDGENLPSDPEDARIWLLRRGTAIMAALRQLSGHLSLGIDVGAWPIKQPVPGLPRGVECTLSCSAIRRIDCRQIAERLAVLADRWRSIIRHLPRMREAA
jgi:hypothetical protein